MNSEQRTAVSKIKHELLMRNLANGIAAGQEVQKRVDKNTFARDAVLCGNVVTALVQGNRDMVAQPTLDQLDDDMLAKMQSALYEAMDMVSQRRITLAGYVG